MTHVVTFAPSFLKNCLGTRAFNVVYGLRALCVQHLKYFVSCTKPIRQHKGIVVHAVMYVLIMKGTLHLPGVY